MKKVLKRMIICLCAALLCGIWGVLRDRETLNEKLIRLHVVAASDSREDQAMKLAVRDAVLSNLSEGLDGVSDVDQARQYILENLPKIEQAANETLKSLGSHQSVGVTLGTEVFDTRQYDTFTLPSGVYEALRITIGEGEGKNWWCVAFPDLCVSAASGGFREAAASAGFDGALTAALQGEQGYEIRFFLLDLLGKWEGHRFKG